MTIAVRPNFQNLDRDPYWSMRSLGLHFDGSFTDSSPTPKAYSPTAANTISSDQSVFGGTSSRFSGSGHASIGPLNGYPDFDFGAGDFTISQFVWFNSIAGDQAILTYGNAGVTDGNNLAWRTRLVGGTLSFVMYNGAANYQANAAGIAVAQKWMHLEWCRSNGTLMCFVDGILRATGNGAPAINNPANRVLRLSYYASTALQYMTGYMDEIRIYKGVALHTSDFRPPQRPFANR